MKIFATSDSHFGHARLVELTGRPSDFGDRLLASVAKNSGDLLIHCGDFAIGKDEEHINAFMEAAKGFKRKVLVKGNHDKKSYSWYLSHGFDHVCESMVMELFSKMVLFTHIPMRAHWPAMIPIVRNIHGHLHGNNHRQAHKDLALYDPSYHYDLAPELHDYQIVSVEKILL